AESPLSHGGRKWPIKFAEWPSNDTLCSRTRDDDRSAVLARMALPSPGQNSRSTARSSTAVSSKATSSRVVADSSDGDCNSLSAVVTRRITTQTKQTLSRHVQRNGPPAAEWSRRMPHQKTALTGV